MTTTDQRLAVPSGSTGLFDLEQLGTASGTDIGLVRSVNQDAFGEFDDLKRGTHLLFVADGMGGHRAGEVASQLAVECVGETFDANDLPADELLQLALERANARIFDASIAEEQFAGMGTTGVALLLTGERTGWIAHVGDSRAYRWREGEFSLLTSDHSVVGELVRRGQLTPEQARIHPQSNEILRALGTQPDVDVELTEVDIEIGDRFLLCSDGLSGMLADEEIGELLGREQPEQAVRTLIRMANDAGGTDNITIQIAEIPTKALGSSDPSGQYGVAEGVAGDVAKVEEESGGASNGSTSAQPTTGGGIAAASTAFRWTVVLMLFAALLLLIFAGSEPSG